MKNNQFNILLATDFSEEVKNAERYAVQFALMTGSKMTILHIYKIPLSVPADREGFAHVAFDLKKHEYQRLERHCIELFRSLGITKDQVPYECIVEEGSIANEINREAERLHADIIITGTHRENGFWDFFRKNHTWGLMKKADIPVLTIPKDGNLTSIRKIVFATEYREGELPALKFLAELAKNFDAELVVLNVTTMGISEEFEAILRQKFWAALEEIDYKKFRVRIIPAENIVDGIMEYCDTAGADWLVMTHSRLLIEKLIAPSKSITKKLSNNTHIPLLAVPDYYHNEDL